MNLELKPLPLIGAFSATLSETNDYRGSFQKYFHSESFEQALPGFLPREIYITTSAKSVLRGMHFQLPPYDHAKVVACLSGHATDVLLDLRPGTGYGRSISIDLTPNGINSVLIPKGIAHGFYAQENETSLLYMVETTHAPKQDAGIHWSSFGHKWPDNSPILSERDQKHPTFSLFKAPERWALT